jgi:membrane protease YdiL (CAAX protease family)
MNIFLNKENNIKNIWWVVLFFLFLSSFLFPLILLADRLSFEITMAHQAILIAIVSIICQLLRRKPIIELTGGVNLTWLKELFLGLIIGAALMIFPVLLLSIFGFVHWEINAFSFSTIYTGFSILLVAAITEELFFRGFIFQRLIQAFGEWPAQLIIAGLFLLTHINNPGMIGIVKLQASMNIFIASIMFGIAFIKTKSLAMPLGLHFMANYTQGTLLGFGVSGDKDPSLLKPLFDHTPIWLSGGDFGIEASILGLCFVIIVTIYLYFWNPKSLKANL